MKKLSEKSRRLLRRIYSVLGAIAVPFLLPACPAYGMPVEYGMPPDSYREDVRIRGQVRSIKTGELIPEICLWIKDIREYPYLTDTDGNFNIYVPKQDNYTVVFTDIDGDENGGPFKQYTANLTKEQCEASKDNPIVITLEEANDLLMRGQVKSQKTGEPVSGIGIWVKDVTASHAVLTADDGSFNVYVPKQDNYTVVFTDVDGPENGIFKQHTINLTREECAALRETPLVIELNEDGE